MDRTFEERFAALLKLAEQTRYAMAQDRKNPAFKIRGQWRIERTDVDPRIDPQPCGRNGGRNGE